MIYLKHNYSLSVYSWGMCPATLMSRAERAFKNLLQGICGRFALIQELSQMCWVTRPPILCHWHVSLCYKLRQLVTRSKRFLLTEVLPLYNQFTFEAIVNQSKFSNFLLCFLLFFSFYYYRMTGWGRFQKKSMLLKNNDHHSVTACEIWVCLSSFPFHSIKSEIS